MSLRATKRGAERTPLGGSYEAVICGASFAGLAVARELAGTGARVLVLERYAIGERQTSACAAPTGVLEQLGLDDSILQRFDELVVHTRFRSFRWRLPFAFATFDYARLCALLWAQSGSAEFETATVTGTRDADGGEVIVETDRGEVSAPLVVDALGWRRVLRRTGDAIAPPAATMSRGLEVHPAGASDDLEVWLHPDCVRRGYGWVFPALDELRVGIGSFDPRDHVKQPTLRLARHVGVPPDGYQGNWIPHALRDAIDGPIFFTGDSAGHCMPATAEGIRPALYFGTVLGRELALVVQGRQTRAQALERYRDFHERHRWAWRWLLRTQRALGASNPYPVLTSAMELMNRPRFLRWSFSKYLNICPPEVLAEPVPATSMTTPPA